MITRFRLPACLYAILLLGVMPYAPGAPAALPAWAAAAASRALPTTIGDADAVILLSESNVEYAANGRRTDRTRIVIRVINREGREQARAAASYRHPADKVRHLSAWLQLPGGAVRTFGRKEIVDFALDRDSLYSESRTSMIDASAEAAAGALFAWEAVTEAPPGHAQGIWRFQFDLPVLLARHQLHLPKGWHATAITLNHRPIPTVATADGLRWEVCDVPSLEIEPLAPSIAQQSGRLCFDITPASTSGRPSGLRTFSNWTEIAQFALTHFATASSSSPALRAKAQELCTAKDTPWDKTRAIADFVQSHRYISIAADLHHDGGFKPRPAQTVLSSGYGDCKDKSSLLCAMLHEVGIVAYPVLIYSGDRSAVHADWPSPAQFNHMGTAISVDESVSSPLVIDDPQAGRLLLFDPTDPFTRIGSFPVVNQGGLVLVCTPSTTQLTRVPFAPPTDNHIRFSTKSILAADGSLAVEYTETDRGAAASGERSQRIERAKARRTLADELKESIPGTISLVAETTDLPGSDDCELTARFLLPKYAHAIRKDLLAIRPVIIGRLPFPPLNEKERTRPLRLNALEREIVAEFTLPEGYRISESGPATRLERPFATYDASVVCEGPNVVFRRKLIVQATDLPASDYEELRSFLDAARKRDNTPILIERF